MKKTGIIGAGWLGMDWAKHLSGDKTCCVRYTNRTLLQRIENCESYNFQFGEELPGNFPEGLGFLFITATLPKERKETLFHFVEELKAKLPRDCKIVFTSTTGVYTDKDLLADEKSRQVNRESVYFQFEQLLRQYFPGKTIILRLGGLIGEDRHPVFSLTGRKDIPGGQRAVNLIHKEDILNFFNAIVQDRVSPGIYNLVYPKHPSRAEYYTQKAAENNLIAPEFTISNEPGKIVSPEKSRQVEGFSYQYEI